MCNEVRVLAVTRDPAVRSVIQSSNAAPHQLLCVSSYKEAYDSLNDFPFCDLLLLDASKDKCVEELSASALIRRVGNSKTCILVDPDDASAKTFSASLRVGCVLSKPLSAREFGEMLERCQRSLRLSGISSLMETKDHRPYHLESVTDHSFFLAANPAMMDLYKNIQKLAKVGHPVLILGESGSGKEIVARLLHKHHKSQDRNFVSVNTAAIPTDLLESELFGYEAGAFTGALKSKPGKFELADKGTLLLDEIGEMSPMMQAKLLHVSQDGTFARLGGRSTVKVDVRILAATNVNLETAIEEKKFREDLYYRISTFTLTVPPLRQRREEIPLLIEEMTRRGAAGAGQEPPTFSGRLMEAAQEYHWPGNLRELRNFVTRLLVLQDEDAAYDQLRSMTRTKPAQAMASNSMHSMTSNPPQVVVSQPAGTQGMKGAVNDLKHRLESSMIQEALLAVGWNRRRAASNLNISYRALLYKIQQHGLSA